MAAINHLANRGALELQFVICYSIHVGISCKVMSDRSPVSVRALLGFAIFIRHLKAPLVETLKAMYGKP